MEDLAKEDWANIDWLEQKWIRDFDLCAHNNLESSVNIEDDIKTGLLKQVPYDKLKRGHRYYSKWRGEEEKLALCMGRFEQVDFDVVVFVETSWRPEEPDGEANFKIRRVNFYEFDINYYYEFIDEKYYLKKSHRLKKARSSNVYTPGTNGLSIKEELMQKTWHPRRVKRLSNKYGYNMLGEKDGGYRRTSRKASRKASRKTSRKASRSRT